MPPVFAGFNSLASYKRRSIRSYRPEKVGREMLDGLVDAGRWAPTAGNAQPWRFIVVDTPERIAKLKSVSPGMFNHPSFIVVVCVNKAVASLHMGPQGELLSLMDVCMAAQNILLAACAMGLGACVIRSFHQRAVAVLLSCPDDVVPELLIAGGYPEREPPAPRRKEVGEIRFFNRWEII